MICKLHEWHSTHKRVVKSASAATRLCSAKISGRCSVRTRRARHSGSAESGSAYTDVAAGGGQCRTEPMSMVLLSKWTTCHCIKPSAHEVPDAAAPNLPSTSSIGPPSMAAQALGTASHSGSSHVIHRASIVSTYPTFCGTLKGVIAAAAARAVPGVDGAEPRAVLDARLTSGEVFADNTSAAAVVCAPQVAPGSISSASATCSSVATCRFCRAAEMA